MPDPTKPDGFVSRIVQQQARRHVIKSTEEQIQKLKVNLNTFKDDIAGIEKVSKRAAAKLVKQAHALGWVDNELNLIAKAYTADTKAVRVADQRLQVWAKRFSGLKQVIQHHAAEITAAAGAGLAFKNLLEQYTTATTQLVQTTGQIGDNSLEAANRADDLATAYRVSVAEMGKFGHAADQAKAAAAELVKLYGGKAAGGADFQVAMETIGSMARVTGKSTDEMMALYRKRFMEQGRTMAETNLELAHVVHGYEDMRGSLEKLNKAGANISIQFKDDFTKSVDEAANEISPMTADLDKVGKFVKVASENASKLGLKLADVNKVSANIGKMLKLPAVLQFQVGKEVLTEVMSTRSKLSATEFDTYLKANFKGQADLVKQSLDDFQKKGPEGLSEWNMSQVVMAAGAGQGMVMAKQMKKLQEMARDKEHFVNYMKEVFGGDTKLALIAREILVKGGTMEDVAKQMEADAKAAGGTDKEANERAEKANKAANETMKKQNEAAKTWLDEWKSWLLSQFQSPIRSLIVTMGGLGAWALYNVVSQRIMAGQVAAVARAADAAAASSGSAVGGTAAAGAAGGAGKIGGFFSRHPKMGSALAVGAVVAAGGYGMSYLSSTDPDKMKKDLEKSVGLSPGDLSTYSSPEKLNAQLAARALQEGETPTPGVGAPTGGGGPGVGLRTGAEAAVRMAEEAKFEERLKEREGFGGAVAGIFLEPVLDWGRKGDLKKAKARAEADLPLKPEGYSHEEITKASDLAERARMWADMGKLGAGAAEEAEYAARFKEMQAKNTELRIQVYEQLLQDLSMSADKDAYLRSKEAEKKLAVIKRIGDAKGAEEVRALAAKGLLGDELSRRREAAKGLGISVASSLGAQEQRPQSGKEVMVGPDGQPLTSLSQAMLRMRFQANNFDPATGALVCEWTNPELLSTIMQTVRLQAQGGKR